MLKYWCCNVHLMYVPKFDVDAEMKGFVSDIMNLVDRVPEIEFMGDLDLRRTNRIRSIQSSVAIEGNTLSIRKVTDIIDGKHVIGNMNEIREVKGAINAYDLIDILNPYSSNDLLRAHEAMTQGLVNSPGQFRQCGVGVYKGNVPIHIAPDHEEVPDLVEELMTWMKDSDLHPLLRSCIFHCRFEFIHPFVDGNGRMGRLWNSLILSKWKEFFAYLPIESWIKLNQWKYYKVLEESDGGNLKSFVKFMLETIRAALDELLDDITYR